MKNAGSEGEFFLATNPELSGSPPRRAPPAVPFVAPSPIMSDITSLPFEATEEDEPVISNSKSFNSGPTQNLTVDDIDDLRESAYEILLAATGASWYLFFLICLCTNFILYTDTHT